jgi:flagellar protein FliS
MTYGNHAYGDQSYGRYLETSVITATPEQLVVMLYEGAIRYSKQAIVQIENRDLQGKRVSVDRALGIVQQLQTSLDMKRGGELAVDLRRLYQYIGSKILQA